MTKILLTFLILTSASCVAFAQGESKCFLNQSLQGENSVTFETKGNKIAGTFAVKNSGDRQLSKTYEFTGTLAGNTLTVKFYKNELPDVAPSEIRSLNWTLVKTSDKEILRIRFYGKNYETNRYADYFAYFESCEPSYATLAKQATAVRFAKGKTSATAPLPFKDNNERKVFSINIRRGQTLEIGAASCVISVYLPNKERYQIVESENNATGAKYYAGTTIDGLLVEPIPQTGNYLVVLRKIGDDAQTSSVTFKITN